MNKKCNDFLSWRTPVYGGILAASLAVMMPSHAYAAPLAAAATNSATVTGQVVDESGEPLIGASVVVKGEKVGATCDIDGNFSIKAPQGATLVVSYVGFLTQEVIVDGNNLNIVLRENNQVLNEVVVVGYGTQKKATMTGSVAVVDDKALSNKGTLSSPVQAIQGQVPGVIVTRSSSAPGDESWNMTLRGAVSANTAAPLVIIDGVEYESINDLRLINPSDIESMNFLKDASASIYGSKAAGGVILITTKKASAGKVKVDYNGSFTYKHIGLSAEMLSLEQWADGIIEATGNDSIRRYAENYTESLEFLSQRPAFDHDLGFLVFCSYGNGYRLTDNKKYRDVILATADSLATLYNPNVGTILSWPRNVEMLGGHNTIMDNMINLEMLFWAAKHGGDHRLYDIAVKHAETTMEHHFRPDFSCYHVAVYDPETGAFIRGITHQGYSDSSMWARGQSWAIYGYTMVYRETHDPRFLDFACKVTDIYLDRLPEDYVPYWDFDDPAIPQAPRDASAACVVASALLELQGYCTGDQQARYRAAAEKMLDSLSSAKYRSDKKRPSFLDHSTGHKPAGAEIDASIIYADYYYLEALLRLKKLNLNQSPLTNLAKL